MNVDRQLIFASAGLRATAVGISGVILAINLASLGLDVSSIGLAISLGLAGCAIGTFAVTYVADRWGRRTTLITITFLMGLGGVMLACSTQSTLIMMSMLVGMVNGMGRDRGAGLTVEQAILPKMATDKERTVVFAWYNLIVDLGHALGSLIGGLPALFRSHLGMSSFLSYQWTWGFYSLLCFSAGLLVFQLSRSVELGNSTPIIRLSLTSRPIVLKFAALSGLDSLGGGFLTTALLGYWFFKRFGVDEGLLGLLFFVVRILNALSHLGAAWLSRRIGLVNTMVWTHLPSSLLLMTVPIAPNLPVAMTLFLIREALVEMDVPTRQSYLMAMVKDEERTRAAGIANVTRSVAWAVAPMVAGFMMRWVSLSTPLLMGPGLKIVYDGLLYRAFRQLKPPEER